jgi:NUMOD1 domain
MIISKALLKYGYSNFSLEILEYCSLNHLRSREQYYFDKLKPEYNILKTAGSLTGYKHNGITLVEIRKRLNKLNLEKGIKVEIFDLETKIKTIYDSMRKASEALNCAKNTIHYYEKQFLLKGINKPFKGRYIIKILRNI